MTVCGVNVTRQGETGRLAWDHGEFRPCPRASPWPSAKRSSGRTTRVES